MSKHSYQHRKYTVVAHDPNWKKTYEDEIKIIKPIFAGKASQIEHIGSTSVPGLDGKPTIDILILVEDISGVDELNSKMESVGYKVLGEYIKPESRLFVKERDNVRLVNLHVFQKDHPHVEEMLQLRDYLRSHPEDAKEYGNLKFELFRKYPNDYASHRKYKDEYVEKLKEKVRKTAAEI